jgi:hypothetical protein
MKRLLKHAAILAAAILILAGCPQPGGGGGETPSSEDTAAAFTGLSANGSATQTTTTLTLTFDKDITGLMAGDITFAPGTTGAVKGTLARTGAGMYELALSGVNASGEVSVSVAKSGYNISGGPKQVTVYYYDGGTLIDAVFTGLSANGSPAQTTTTLTLTFDKDITGLTAGDITFAPENTGAVKGTMARTGSGMYELALSGVNASGEVSVSVVKTGYTISSSPKQVTVYYYGGGTLIDAVFTGLSANGSATQTTTTLTLTFDKDITGLTAGDITFAPGTTGAVKGTLIRTSAGMYELALSGITAGGEVSVSVAKSGYNISGGPKQVTVYYYGGGALTDAAFTGLSANGSPAQTTTTLTLTFDKDITGLSAGDITFAPENTGAVKGTLARTGAGVYELALSGVNASGEVSVSVTKSGYNISGGPKQVTVYYYGGGTLTDAVFTGLSANGSASETTTKLTLTFDKDITGLMAGDITLTPGTTGAVKGTLARTGAGTYELALSGVSASGEVSVSVTKSGYNISGGSKTAQVYYYGGPPGSASLTITFAQIADAAPSINTELILYRYTSNSTGRPVSADLAVANPEQYDSGSISWWVDNTTVTGTGASFTLSASNAAYNSIAKHFITVTVIKDGVPYNRTVSFKVEY